MAKLGSVIKTGKPIPLGIEGIYILNLAAKTVDETFGNIQERLEKDQEGVIVSLFNDLICDEDGNPFEDCSTFDQITETLSVRDIHNIVSHIPRALSPSDADQGK